MGGEGADVTRRDDPLEHVCRANADDDLRDVLSAIGRHSLEPLPLRLAPGLVEHHLLRRVADAVAALRAVLPKGRYVLVRHYGPPVVVSAVRKWIARYR